jgi:RimJ/RimL family protein N-acetyltransferase
MDVRLREVEDSDLPLFHAMLRDPEATKMAAFTVEDPDDQARFDAHWAKVLEAADPVRTVLRPEMKTF